MSSCVHVMAQSIPSVFIPPPPPPGHLSSICGAGRFIKKTHAGALNSVQMPHRGTIPKFHFPANKLQMPNLWESVKI